MPDLQENVYPYADVGMDDGDNAVLLLWVHADMGARSTTQETSEKEFIRETKEIITRRAGTDLRDA